MDLYVTLIGRVYLVTIILYKKAMELFWYCDGKLVVTVNRLTYNSSALWRQRKSKNTAHYIPILLRGLGEAVVTNDWCIIYSL